MSIYRKGIADVASSVDSTTAAVCGAADADGVETPASLLSTPAERALGQAWFCALAVANTAASLGLGTICTSSLTFVETSVHTFECTLHWQLCC